MIHDVCATFEQPSAATLSEELCTLSVLATTSTFSSLQSIENGARHEGDSALAIAQASALALTIAQ